MTVAGLGILLLGAGLFVDAAALICAAQGREQGLARVTAIARVVGPLAVAA